MPSTYGSFDTRFDLESSLKSAHPERQLNDLALPASPDETLLLVHPWFAPTFATSIDPDWDSEEVERFTQREVETVFGSSHDVSIQIEYVGTDEVANDRVDRLLITCLPNSAYAFRNLIRAPKLDVRSTLGVLAEILIGRSTLSPEPAGVSAATGWYRGLVEVCVVERGALRCAGYVRYLSETEAWDQIGTFVSMFSQSDARPSKLLVYGEAAEEGLKDAGHRLFGSDCTTDFLRPSDLFGASVRTNTDRPLYGLTAAGAFTHLLSDV